MIFSPLLLAAGLSLQQPALDPQWRQAIDDVLFAANLTYADLKAEEPLLTGCVPSLQIHEEPVEAIWSLAGRLLQASKQPTLNPLDLTRQTMGRAKPPQLSGASVAVALPADVPEPMREPFRHLVRIVVRMNDEVRSALKELNTDQKRELIEGLPRHAVHPSLLSLEFVSRPMPEWRRLRELLDRVELDRIQAVSEWAFGEIEASLLAIAHASPPSFRSKLRFEVEGLHVVLSGFGDDVHEDRDAQLMIDVGGSDKYLGRPGAGIGYASVFADLDGDDVYHLPDVALGAGLLGIGLAWDRGGQDLVRAKSISLGAGIAGTGCFVATGPASATKTAPDWDDVFISAAMTQGFGMRGTGAFARSGGSDTYRCAYLGQGAGISAGSGFFVDTGGSDRMVSLGLAPGPLGGTLRSRCQGFGGLADSEESGLGGSGICVVAGQAHLTAEWESQGAGLDGGIGFVALGGGSHRLDSGGLGLGFGARQGVGAVVDAGGSDAFRSMSGGAIGVGMDSGLGLVLDAEGDDTFDSAGGDGAFAVSGGLGLVLDFAGSDRTMLGRGSGLPSSGMGLMVDRGGAQTFALSRSGPRIAVESSGRVVGLLEAKQDVEAAAGAETAAGQPLSGAHEAGRAVLDASGLAPYATLSMRRQARADLAASKGHAVEWLLSLARPLKRDEAAEIAACFGGQAPEPLLRGARSSTFIQARNCLSVLGLLGSKAGASAVLAGLEREELAASAAEAARLLRLSEASSSLMLLAGSRQPLAQRRAAAALAELGGPEAEATAQALLGASDPFVRQAAVAFYGRLKPSLGPLMSAVERSDEVAARAAMLAIAGVGGPDALRFLGEKLADRRPGIRIEALLGLAGRCPREHRAEFDARRGDADLRVRAVALGLDPGP